MKGDQGLLDDKPQWDTFAEALPQIVWVTRCDGYHIHFNQRWYDYTGLTQEESIGFGWSVTLHPDDIEFFRCFSDFMDGETMREQAWAWRSAAASSNGTTAGSRRAARPVREPPFL